MFNSFYNMFYINPRQTKRWLANLVEFVGLMNQPKVTIDDKVAVICKVAVVTLRWR
jgi:hypothetical protein